MSANILDNCLITIPAYNEATNIADVIREIKNCYKDSVVLVVDDGSTDNTAKVALKAGAEVVKHPFNMGIGSSRITGYKYAIENGYKYLVQLDGDGQHDPSSIESLLNNPSNSDVVIGSRFIEGKEYKMPIFRNIGRVFFCWLFKLIFRTKITDPTSGFRLFNYDALVFLVKHEFFDYPEIESLEVLLRGGFKISEAQVKMGPRQNGKSSIDFFQSAYYMFKVSLSFFIMILQRKEKKQFLR